MRVFGHARVNVVVWGGLLSEDSLVGKEVQDWTTEFLAVCRGSIIRTAREVLDVSGKDFEGFVGASRCSAKRTAFGFSTCSGVAGGSERSSWSNHWVGSQRSLQGFTSRMAKAGM